VLPIEVFDGFRQQLAANRTQFYLDIASAPFYSYNRPDAKIYSCTMPAPVGQLCPSPWPADAKARSPQPQLVKKKPRRMLVRRG
jgi:hypothetical protein